MIIETPTLNICAIQLIDLDNFNDINIKIQAVDEYTYGSIRSKGNAASWIFDGI